MPDYSEGKLCCAHYYFKHCKGLKHCFKGLLYVCVCVYYITYVRVQLFPTVCNPLDYSPLGSAVHEIFQARILEWQFPPPGDLPNPGIKPEFPMSPALAGRFFTIVPANMCIYIYIYLYIYIYFMG